MQSAAYPNTDIHRGERGQRDKLAVMQLILNLDIGGAQQVVRTLAKYLDSDQCTPVVCSFQDGPLRKEIEQLGIPV